jgi:hypothetical protein
VSNLDTTRLIEISCSYVIKIIYLPATNSSNPTVRLEVRLSRLLVSEIFSQVGTGNQRRASKTCSVPDNRDATLSGFEKVWEIDVSPTVCKIPLDHQKASRAYTHPQAFGNVLQS